MSLDVEFVRRQFPAFEDPELSRWAHFENAGGSYVCRQVIERLDHFYKYVKVQPGHPFLLSRVAYAEVEAGYRRLANWIGVEADELYIGPSTSQNTYVLARSFLPLLSDTDEIIVSTQDHEANAGVWRRLADEAGATLREWRVDPDSGHLRTVDLEQLLGDRTRLVVFPHASNLVASINPVVEVVERAASARAYVVVDGVSYAPHGLPDVGGLGVDVYLFSTYKTWGPHQGAMVVRRELAEQLANQGHYFHRTSRYKLIPAGSDFAQVAACSGLVEYLEEIDAHHFGFPTVVKPTESNRRVRGLFRQHEQTLLTPLLAYLSGRPDVRLLGLTDPQARVSTVSILPLRRDLAEVAVSLAEDRMMVGIGDFYAPRLLDEMGIPTDPGVLRISFIHYNLIEEIERLIEALDRALG